jgi:hypothetical protein
MGHGKKFGADRSPRAAQLLASKAQNPVRILMTATITRALKLRKVAPLQARVGKLGAKL